MTSLAPQKTIQNHVFDRFSGIKVSKIFVFFLSKNHTFGRKKYSVFNGCYLIYDASLIMIQQAFYEPKCSRKTSEFSSNNNKYEETKRTIFFKISQFVFKIANEIQQ